MQLQPGQIYPPTINIKDTAIKQWADDLLRFLDDIIGKIAAIPFNRSETLSVADSGNADTQFSLTHHLLRIPTGLIVTSIDKGGVVYKGTTAWTTTAIYLKCNMANAVLELCVF